MAAQSGRLAAPSAAPAPDSEAGVGESEAGRAAGLLPCSLEPEENEEVVAEFPVTETIRRWPGIDDGDGFFAAILEKR